MITLRGEALRALDNILGFNKGTIMCKVAALRAVEATAKEMADKLEDWRSVGYIKARLGS